MKAQEIYDDVMGESERLWKEARTAEHQALGFDAGPRGANAPPAEVSQSGTPAEPDDQDDADDQADAERDATEYLGDVFEARPVLAHIRTAARARRVAPAAVLGNVLGRVSAFTHPSRCVPPYVGSHAPLSLFPATMAETGGGKSTPARCSEDLLPHTPHGCIGPVSLGSGEGIAELYLENVEANETDDDGKTRKVTRKRQTRHGVLLILDEGRALGEMANRAGAVLVPALCSAWLGGPLGQSNASTERYRQVAAGNYSIGLITAWQPKMAAALFDDTDGGLPGRFLFVPAIDRHAPDIRPEWPGALKWQPLTGYSIEGRAQHTPFTYPAAVEAEADAAHVGKLRGEWRSHPLDAHRMLHRLKVAAVLADLEGRDNVTEEDWQIASRILDASDIVRAAVVDILRSTAVDKERTAAERAARRETVLADTAENRALKAAARAVGRRAHRDGNTDPLPRRALTQAVKGKDRRLISVDDALELAVAEGWLDPDGDAYRPGRSTPS